MAAVNFDETTDKVLKRIENELEELRVHDYQMGYKAGYHDAILNVKKGMADKFEAILKEESLEAK